MSAFDDKVAIDGSAPNSNKDDGMTPADFQDQPKEAKTWKILKMKHKCYNERALDVKKEELLYQGGFQMNRPDIASLFCPKLRNEEDGDVYDNRVASAAYLPTFSKLITGLISTLFSQDLAVMEATDHKDKGSTGETFTDQLRNFYKDFQNNCDGHGLNLHDFMRESTTSSLIHSFNYFGLDFPKGEADNLLEQNEKGLLNPFLYKIDCNSVFDWQMKDGSNEFEWIKLVDCRSYQPTPFDPPMHQYFVKSWFFNELGEVAYECYQSEPLPPGKEPKDKDIIKKVDEGTVSFLRIPIFMQYLNDGIAVGRKLAPMAAELFNRTTIENDSTNKACLTIPTLNRGDIFAGDGNGLPNPSGLGDKTRPRAKVSAKGVLELGGYQTDRFSIVEAEGKALQFIHKQNEDLDEKMHSVVNQMGQALAQAKSQSGKTAASKQEDRRATEMLLTAIADEVYTVVQNVFKAISESFKQEVVWEVKGLSSIAQEDRAELTQEILALPKLSIPSPTFMKEYHYRLASRLVEGTDQRTLQTIRGEIEDGIDGYGLTGLPPVDEDKVSPDKPSVKASDDEPITLGPSGQQQLPDGSHLQTGAHVDPMVVYNQLLKDYKPKDLEWVKTAIWRGPLEISTNDVSFEGQEDWTASKPGPQGQEKVDKFAEKLSDKGFTDLKPIILANMPHNNEKYTPIDGRHRLLAAQKANLPVLAYIADVGSMDSTTPHMQMHGKQIGANNSSGGSNTN